MIRNAVRQKSRRAWLAAPALAGTAASAVLTVAVVTLWLGPLIGPWLAMLIGLGFDGAWLAALAYERRLAAQGDHDRRVTLVGWAFGLAATGLLVAHALTAGAGTAAWLAVSWLPIAAKALWWLHGLWEATELSPAARSEIGRVLQDARDSAAIARASLTAQTRVERVRMETLASAGATVAKVQAKASKTLAGAWSELEYARSDSDRAHALACVASPATPAAAPRWDIPAWTPVAALRPQAAGALDDAEDVDAIVARLATETDPPRSYRAMAARFREEGHRASDTALRAAWRRVTGAEDTA